ncbi:bifunctional diaminohydroxyphosphoribosylaminopyrimidine deaminase/5-amino-6-(5-phosphoribosylamino)uracil reductase RibD [Methylobacillus gramineus]|uniref:bifunctional diaminohydroxyphosphoribosylaminopyrimidine deaminase/5-amino-6-(5-phosphoribosylamino)uracil reductase RibD n=1 Tax=Methylobacillus gramineus TaxID=755169 RepID=UPI001CFF8301|nr:bifunctional diaminohydroxyphosphoribosylaminopyrimidine deaminase/5-amino-6-(5-phosphoribosylamino)uracil reductase RibD [Methylobacillus gramineus]MCB5183824.1 bifunctional diaminohydroxyphosphoribosylaminopyrimidine deaminase/5-amino-6-(5-phosphoribosylamino)uracil reductase RibD [Methylobacillus gramineus]
MTISTRFSALDHQYMAVALRQAARGLYTTSPNPRVGCVIVKDGRIVGQGAHLRAGKPHAEVHALREAGALAAGADAYVTLEPCSHFGRTPPCADALIKAGVRRVVAAMQDPNPLVAGNGLKRLAEQGIVVASGLLEAEAMTLNAGFVSRMTRQQPFVRSKIAASLDGKTGLLNGQSQWITGAAARHDVQRWRAQSCAILTGVATILADDPQLTVRDDTLLELKHGLQPWRIIVDSHLRMPTKAKILAAGRVLIAHVDGKPEYVHALQEAGAEVVQLVGNNNRVCLASLLKLLGERQINELMVEAGQAVNGSLLQQGLVDELLLYYAPVILGDQARGMFAMDALTDMRQKLHLHTLDTRQVGADLFMRAKPILAG